MQGIPLVTREPYKCLNQSQEFDSEKRVSN